MRKRLSLSSRKDVRSMTDLMLSGAKGLQGSSLALLMLCRTHLR
jgi:hypothetical protein